MTFLVLALICAVLAGVVLMKTDNPITFGCLGLLVMFFLFAGCTSLVYDNMTRNDCPYRYTGCP